MPRRMKGGLGPLYDFNTGRSLSFEDDSINKLRQKYNGATDEQIIDGKMGNGGGIQALNGGLNFIFKEGVIPWKGDSKLVGVRGDSLLGRGAQLDKPVFYTTSIPGQKPGSFWTFEDEGYKRAGGTSWINMVPISDDGKTPFKDPIKGVYLFTWAANVGDSAYRGAANVGEGTLQTGKLVGEGALYGLSAVPAALIGAAAYSGGKRTKKRKMNKRKKTLRKKSKRKRKTVKGGKRRKSKNFKRTRK